MSGYGYRSNGWTTTNTELEKMWNDSVAVKLKAFSRHYFNGAGETTVSVNQGREYRDLIQTCDLPNTSRDVAAGAKLLGPVI
jgi:hypothetical protein